MPERELFVPFPDSMRTAPETTAVRSTTIIVSRQGIEDRGHFGEYKKHLPADSEAELEAAVAGIWLPIQLAIDHYVACDRLQLGVLAERELGGLAVRKLGDTVMGTITKGFGSAGIVSLWDVLRRYSLFFSANFRGGGSRVWKVGPKDAILEICGFPLARVPYLRHAYGGLLSEGARFLVTTSHVAEVPRLCTPTTLGFRVSWV
ncbi:MAG TPA: hypothetical protein VGI39_40555 [Polyangiaceae bacterium]|jgi:hypothetical protein